MSELRHESPIIWPRSILLVAGALLATVIAVQGIGLWMFDAMARPIAQPPSFPLDSQVRDDLPARPRLDGIERLQGKRTGIHADDLRANRQVSVSQYDWIDRKAGVVRIPIDRAMKIVVETNLLPARRAPEK